MLSKDYIQRLLLGFVTVAVGFLMINFISIRLQTLFWFGLVYD